MPVLDFLEIGTSDFGTLIQQATDDTVGISVESIKYYLDRLPNKKNVKKINCAVSNYSGTISVFYVDVEKIKKYDIPDWARGCNSVNNQHPTIRNILRNKGLNPDEIFTEEKVQVLSFADLAEENDIDAIKLLKLDTEGHDCIILENYADYCQKHPTLLADKIVFESNILSKAEDVSRIIHRFLDTGYKLLETGYNTTLAK